VAGWVVNSIALLLVAAVVGLFALALLWRIGSWQIAPADTLMHDEGLPIGSIAPEIAARARGDDYHLSFQGQVSFVVLGNDGCRHCAELLRSAALHPATRHMRLVYISDVEDVQLEPDILPRWERYVYVDEERTRRVWEAPVSPYFHVINAQGRVIDKGIGSKPDHLDRLLHLRPGATKPLQPVRAGDVDGFLEVGDEGPR